MRTADTPHLIWTYNEDTSVFEALSTAQSGVSGDIVIGAGLDNVEPRSGEDVDSVTRNDVSFRLIPV